MGPNRSPAGKQRRQVQRAKSVFCHTPSVPMSSRRGTREGFDRVQDIGEQSEQPPGRCRMAVVVEQAMKVVNQLKTARPQTTSHAQTVKFRYVSKRGTCPLRMDTTGPTVTRTFSHETIGDPSFTTPTAEIFQVEDTKERYGVIVIANNAFHSLTAVYITPNN